KRIQELMRGSRPAGSGGLSFRNEFLITGPSGTLNWGVTDEEESRGFAGVGAVRLPGGGPDRLRQTGQFHRRRRGGRRGILPRRAGRGRQARPGRCWGFRGRGKLSVSRGPRRKTAGRPPDAVRKDPARVR